MWARPRGGDIDGPAAAARIQPHPLAYRPVGTIYFGDAGTNSVLISRGPTALGTDPRLLNVTGILVAGPGQLIVQSESRLFKVTLP